MNTFALEPRNTCALCGSTETSVFIPFEDIPVVQCDRCGFKFSAKVLPADELNAYYSNNFGSRRHMQGQEVNAQVNSFVLEKLTELKRGARVLDVGSGYGFLLKKLLDRFHIEGVGVELSRQEASFAKEKLGLNIVNSSLGTSGLPRNSFDLVMTFEVIEHVTLPVEFISTLREYVRPGGKLLIATDNFEGKMAKALGPSLPKWIPHSHVSHFSPASLSKAIAEAGGLTITRSVSFTPWELHGRNLLYRLLGVKKSPAEAFHLATTLQGEMHGQYRLFRLRKLFSRLWASFALRESADGDLMYFLAAKSV